MFEEIVLLRGTVRSNVTVTSIPYALSLLTTVPALRVRSNVQLAVAVLVPSVSATLAALSSQEAGSLLIPVSSADVAAVGIPPVNAGEPNTIYVDNAVNIIFAGQPIADPPAAPVIFNFNGADGSTSISSSSGGPVTATVYGTAALDTSNKKFGTASLFLDGPQDASGDWITYDLPQAFGLNDFCIEFWIYTPSSVQNDAYVTAYSFGNGCALDMEYLVNPVYNLYISNNISGPSTITVNAAYGQWQHIAVYRISNVFYLAVDGVVCLTPITDQTTNFNDVFNVIGDYYTVDGYYALSTSWIDEVRVTFGSSVYGTTNFTAPTGPF
jgi:hypothetical protein